MDIKTCYEFIEYNIVYYDIIVYACISCIMIGIVEVYYVVTAVYTVGCKLSMACVFL